GSLKSCPADGYYLVNAADRREIKGALRPSGRGRRHRSCKGTRSAIMRLRERTARRGLLAILLDTCRAQAGEAVAIDRILPGEELFDRQRVPAAGFLEREKSAADGGDDFGLAANHPALRSWRREIGNCQRAAVGPDDILHPRAVGFGHVTLTHWIQEAPD